MTRGDIRRQGSIDQTVPLLVEHEVTNGGGVTDLGVFGAGSDVTLSWQLVAGATYEVRLGREGAVVPVTATHFQFRNLSADTPYVMYVRSVVDKTANATWASVRAVLATHVEGDPTFVVGLGLWNQPIPLRPGYFSASASPRYCNAGDSLVVRASGTNLGSGDARLTVEGPDNVSDRTIPYRAGCGDTPGIEGIDVSATRRMGQDMTPLTLSVPIRVHPVPTAISGTVATVAGGCEAEDIAYVLWSISGGSPPHEMWISGMGSRGGRAEVRCPAMTGANLRALALDSHGAGVRLQSAAITVRSSTRATPCSAARPQPTSVSHEVREDGTFTFSWDEDGSPCTAGYQVQLNGDVETRQAILSGQQLTLSSVEAESVQQFRVRTSYGTGAPSDWAQYVVLPTPVLDGTPAVTSSTVAMKWQAVSGASGYQVRLVQRGSPGNAAQIGGAVLPVRPVLETKKASAREHTFVALRPETTYKLGVCAKFGTKCLGWSKSTVTTSAAVAVPASPSLTISFGAWEKSTGGKYSIEAKWPAVAGATDYEVAFGAESAAGDAAQAGTSDPFACSVENEATRRYFCGLSPEETYKLAVRAVRAKGSDPSRTVKSEPGVVEFCLGPCEVRVSEVSASGVRVDWEGLFERAFIHEVRIVKDGRVVANFAGQSKGLTIPSSKITTGGALKAETTYRAEVRTWYTLRSGWGAWAGVDFTTPTAPKPEPLTLAVTPSASTCLTGESVSVSWSVTGGSGKYEVSVDGNKQSGSSATVTCQATAGDHTVTVVVTDKTHATLTKTQTITLTVTKPKVEPPTGLSVDAEVTSLTLKWKGPDDVTGYSVRIDGGAETKLQATTLSHPFPGLTPSTKYKLEVRAYIDADTSLWASIDGTTTAPPALALTASVMAQIQARRLTDNRVEFRLRLADGMQQTTANRYMKLPEVTAGRWYSSSAFTATIEGVDYTLGAVSVRLDNTVCPAKVEVTFIPTGGERITPTKYKLPVNREADRWAMTTEFAVPLQPSSTVPDAAQSGAGHWMIEAPEGTNDGPGRAGGAMLGDSTDAPDRAQADNTQTSCTDQPKGLQTSALTSRSVRLSWQAVSGASEYDVAVDQEASKALASTQRYHDFTGLAADTDYTLRVRARSWRGSSEWTSKTIRTTVSSVPLITITSGTSPIDEGDSAGFTVTSDRATAAALTVKLSITESGAMINGTPPTEVTIASGLRTASVTVATEDDERDESDSVVTAKLVAGSGYRPGLPSSAAVTVSDDDGQVSALTLTISASPTSCETGGVVTVSWIVTGGSGSYVVTVEGVAQTGSSGKVTCQAKAGTQSVSVKATDQTHTYLTATETLTLTVADPVTLTASASPTSCETDGEVTVSWIVTGGSGSHTVTVDGDVQTGSSTKVTCQAKAGTQTVIVKAVDKRRTQLTATKALKLTVTAPPSTVKAKLWARRTADNRIELDLRLVRGTLSTVSKRYAIPPVMTDLGWKNSEALSATIGGRTYTIGKLSARLQNDRCPSRVEIGFLPSKGARFLPDKRFIGTDSTVGTWRSSTEFEIALAATESASSDRASAGEAPPATYWLDDTPDATDAGLGIDGGSMDGDEPNDAPADRARADAQSNTTPTCPSAPRGLTTSQVGTNQIRLGWTAVSGATQYDLRLDGNDVGPVNPATTSYQFAGLSPDHSYQLGVRARDAWGASNWSSLSKRTLPLPPADPSGLQVTETTNSLTLSWGSADRATSYQVRLDGGQADTPNLPPRSHKFSGLRADHSYDLEVQAINRGGESGWVKVSAKTKPTPVLLVASVSPSSCETGGGGHGDVERQRRFWLLPSDRGRDSSSE